MFRDFCERTTSGGISDTNCVLTCQQISAIWSVLIGSKKKIWVRTFLYIKKLDIYFKKSKEFEKF
jgi:hypothetical protein